MDSKKYGRGGTGEGGVAGSTISAPPPVPLPGPRALPSYARMGRYIAGGAALDPRVELLVRQLAAELLGCRWCIEHGLHRWRQAFLPVAELGAVRRYAASPLFSARERAALAFTEAVSRYTDRAGGISQHFFNPATGALGAGSAMRNLCEWAEASSPRESGRALVTPHPSAPAPARLFQGQDLAPPAADRRGGDQELRLCIRSEEHTSELQSPCNLVCRLLLEKKKKQ